MRHLFRILCITLLLGSPLSAQIQPTTVAELEESIELRQQHYEQSILKSYPVRNVGPVVMSGRVSDIAVHPDNPRVFYTGFGSGGIFKTTNSGNTMFPVFDHAGGALGIGDIALSPADPDIIWAGTGENNSSRSTYAGTGVYKSMEL